MKKNPRLRKKIHFCCFVTNKYGHDSQLTKKKYKPIFVVLSQRIEDEVIYYQFLAMSSFSNLQNV